MSKTHMSQRVLKLNVGFLLSTGAGHSHNSVLDLPTTKVADDLILNYIRGPIRLSRTKEGLLVQAKLDSATDGECYRCLEDINHKITLDLEELYAYQSNYDSEFRISEDAILDLGPLVRAEAFIELSQGMLCQPDCLGLCAECGGNRNRGECRCEVDDIDPRLAVLKQLLK